MINVLVWLGILPASAALTYFAVEVSLGLIALPERSDKLPKPRFVIVIPAHNEDASISYTVRRLNGDASTLSRVLVVADNCTDATAAAASKAGATVIERRDESRRGKSFALEFARAHLASNPPDVVVILDADCHVRRGSLDALAAIAMARQAPAQCLNLLSAPAGSPPLVLLSNFAMRVKNLVRARGLFRLGGGVPLFGTGMAFPWPVFQTMHLATSEAVEDIRLSLQLAASGVRVEFCQDTEVVSPAAQLKDTLGQRARWEHGFLVIAARYSLPLLVTGIAKRSRHLTALALHMLIPPLALLLILSVFLVAATWMFALTESTAPFAVITLSLFIAIGSLFAAWMVEGRHELTFKTLAFAPLYILWKVPLYIKFFTSRQRKWNRTPRISDN